MVQLTDQEQQKLKELGVAALYLFGSRAQGIAGPLSDYDFAVLMRDAKVTNDAARFHRNLYAPMYDILSDVVGRDDSPPPPDGHFRNIDIVFLQRDTVPLELRFHVIRHGRTLYDRDPKIRGQFEERTMLAYCDFRPMLDVFDRTILASL